MKFGEGLTISAPPDAVYSAGTKQIDASIIIPAFNAGTRLNAAIASALAQDDVLVEVIVIDDASSDDTADIAAKWAERDRRVTFIKRVTNGGPAAARNDGLASARGRWIGLLDGDDEFESGRLCRMITRAEAAGFDLIADNQLLIEGGDHGTPELMFGELRDAITITPEMFVEGNLPVKGQPRNGYGFLKPVIRREFLTSHGLVYDTSLRLGEDYDFLLRSLVAGGRLLFIPEPGYRYTVRDDSLTANHTIADLYRLRAVDLNLLARVDTVAHAGLRRVLRRRVTSLNQRLYWRLFIDDVKRRAFLTAFSRLASPPAVALHILKQCALQFGSRVLRLPLNNPT